MRASKLVTRPDPVESAGSPPDDRGARALITGLALVVIALGGLALRLYRLDAQSVWYDESFTVAQSVKPWGALFAALVLEGGRHPPLHYWLLHGWFDLVGFGAWEARLLSAVLGTLAIPLLYALTRRFADRPTALCAALLLAVSQIAVYFSQEARAYMTAQCLSLVAALAFMALLARPTLLRTAALAAATLLLLATHYYGAATVLALVSYWALFRRSYSPLVRRRLILAGALTAAAYAPWPLALRASAEAQPARMFHARDVSERPSLLSPVMAVNRFNSGKFASVEGSSSPVTVALGLLIFTVPIAVALGATSLADATAGSGSSAVLLARQGLVLGGLLAALPVAMAMLFGVAGATFNYRHYSFAVPGYVLAVALAWRVCFRHRDARVAWLAVALGWSGVALRANYAVATKPDYRGALAPMAAAARRGDCAVVRPAIWNDALPLPWDVYYPDRERPRAVPLAALPQGLADCDRLWVIADRTWWMNRDEAAPAARLQAALPAAFALVSESRHPALELRLYRRVTSR